VTCGDAGQGRMKQLVSELILGNALGGSSGSSDCKPLSGNTIGPFGAHYFFEQWFYTKSEYAHAAYATGNSFPLYQAKHSERNFT
jgi:hypothetical protein